MATAAAGPRYRADGLVAFATRLLGMQAVDRGGGMRAFRMDDRAQRLIVSRDAGPATIEVPDDLADALKAEPEARAMFERLTSQNRYAVLYRIVTAKKPETRQRRIEKFVAMLARGETIHPQKT